MPVLATPRPGIRATTGPSRLTCRPTEGCARRAQQECLQGHTQDRHQWLWPGRI